MDIQTKLNQQGLRLTQPRRAVLSVLEDAAVPLSPQTIHEHASAAQQKIGLVTVYRTLDLLTELDLVRRVHGQDGCHGYVLASPGHHHVLVCQHCGIAVEFSGSDDLEALLDRIQDETGFIIDGHLLQLHGLCPACQKEAE
jgi:Fe2+ or Zn2+ uptake regulation protein